MGFYLSHSLVLLFHASFIYVSYAFYLLRNDSQTLISPSVDALANSMLTSWNSSGLAVAVVRRDPTVPGGWRREYASYGIAKDDGTPVTPDTIFAIASNSKLFLTFSVGLLISNETLVNGHGKKLDWTTKMQDILPEWGLMDEIASKETNIQDMLSHRTGLPGHIYTLTNGSSGTGIPEMIASMKTLRPSAQFRDTFQYNNMMYCTLSYLPVVLLNQSYESYIAQHLFGPLNMSSSTYSIKDAEASGRFAHGFELNTYNISTGARSSRAAVAPYYLRSGHEKAAAGGGGVLTSARDMSIWVSMLLNNGRHPDTNETIVPEEVVNHAATGVTIDSAIASYPELAPTLYGSGQRIYSYRGHEIIEHGGSIMGFKSQVTRYPNDNLAIVVLSNDFNAGLLAEAVKWRITDEIFGLSPIDWDTRYRNEIQASNSARQAVTPRPENAQPPGAPYESLERSYSHPAYGILHPCYVNISRVSSPYCSSVLNSSNVKAIIAASDIEQPTYIIPFKHELTTHIHLAHFTNNTFNVSMIWINKEDREAEGYGSEGYVLRVLDLSHQLEWVNPGQSGEGLALKKDFWLKGSGGRAPEGQGESSAEVWFKRDP